MNNADKRKEAAFMRKMKDKRERAQYVRQKKEMNVDAINREIVKYERRVKPFMPPYVLETMDR